jgi:hypothetical protein
VTTNTLERAHLNAYVDRDVRNELERIARDNDRSLSAEVRLGLRAHVERADETDEEVVIPASGEEGHR